MAGDFEKGGKLEQHVAGESVKDGNNNGTWRENVRKDGVKTARGMRGDSEEGGILKQHVAGESEKAINEYSAWQEST